MIFCFPDCTWIVSSDGEREIDPVDRVTAVIQAITIVRFQCQGTINTVYLSLAKRFRTRARVPQFEIDIGGAASYKLFQKQLDQIM